MLLHGYIDFLSKCQLTITVNETALVVFNMMSVTSKCFYKEIQLQ